MPYRIRNRLRGECGQRCRTIRRRQSACRLYGKVIAIERLGRRCIEERVIEHRRQYRLVDAPRRRQRAPLVVARARLRLDPAVDQAVRRPRIERDQRVVAICRTGNEGDVADPAQVQHRDRPVERGRQRRMVDRQQRRALPPRRHIGRPEIGYRRDPRRACHRSAVADLPSPAAIGPMRDRLSVEPDHIDLRRGDTGIRQQLVYREDMRTRDEIARGDDRRTGARPIERQRHTCRVGQLRARRIRIRLPTERDGADHRLAIGLDQRGVDPVERRPRHQSNRQHFGSLSLSSDPAMTDRISTA